MRKKRSEYHDKHEALDRQTDTLFRIYGDTVRYSGDGAVYLTRLRTIQDTRARLRRRIPASGN